jgi:hypothetical protein
MDPWAPAFTLWLIIVYLVYPIFANFGSPKLAAFPISHKPSHLLSRIDLAGVDVEPGRASGEGLRGNMLTA